MLFLSSIAALSFNSVTAFLLPGQEEKFRNMVHDASQRLADAATDEAVKLPDDIEVVPESTDARLTDLTRDALAGYPGVEGGFYINSADSFAGFAFPSDPARGPKHHGPRTPPPREEPYIRLQAHQSAMQTETSPLIQTRDVGPSRVMVATVPVGTTRPARLVAWLMYRVTGPEQQRQQVFRYQASTILALAGIITALLLTLNLRRTLGRERQARDQLQEELRRSEHLASLGLLLAQVAHEIRNPLAGIRSTVQLWQRLPKESQTPESMQSVVTAVDRLNSLLTDLLYFSRSELTDRESIDLNSLVRETMEFMRAQALQQQVQIELNLAPQLPRISGSARALRQVVINLATNALQAMPQSGRLQCRTSLNPAGDTVVLEIADTGAGIDPSVRSRLFEPFFTTRDQGTGLGLALCREIVLQHGGQIELVDEAPRGTVCRITIPVPPEEQGRQ
jgi:two-component system sensor histidine kinase HydH